jgi:hypothetical protein
MRRLHHVPNQSIGMRCARRLKGYVPTLPVPRRVLANIRGADWGAYRFGSSPVGPSPFGPSHDLQCWRHIRPS